MSMMVSFCAVLNLIESVSEGFPTYYYQFLPILVVQVMMFKRKKKTIQKCILNNSCAANTRPRTESVSARLAKEKIFYKL